MTSPASVAPSGSSADPGPGRVSPARALVLWRRLTAASTLPRWAVASLVANVGIVVTGALVRLTASGLGCPTWPRCTADSYVSQPEYGIHGVIEFGNRLLTFVLAAVLVMTLLSALRIDDRRRSVPGGGVSLRVRTIALVLLAGVPAQAVIGGITVRTELNPFIVAPHLLVSIAMISGSTVLVHRAFRWTRMPVLPAQRVLVRFTFVVLALAIWMGTVVTGSGPHAGDPGAARTGFDPALVSHIHANIVYVGVAATCVGVGWLRSRAAVLLLGALLVQAGIGIVQYNVGLPIGLVLLHLLGAAITTAAVTHYVLSVGPQQWDPRGPTHPHRSRPARPQWSLARSTSSKEP